MAILANLTTSGRVSLTEMVKRHIYGPRSFIGAYNQVSLTFRSKVLARTSSSLEKPLFFVYFDQFGNFRSGVFDRNGQKPHLHIQTFRLSPLLSPLRSYGLYKKSMTDGHPKPTGPQPFGLGPKNQLYNRNLIEVMHLAIIRDMSES